jgi:flagellar motor switch protein FliM
MDEIPPVGGDSEILSQSDVEKLLAQVADQEAWAAQSKAPVEKERKQGVVQPYDFRMPVFLSAVELRKLRVEHDEFVLALGARLSNYLRLEVGLQLSKINTVTFQEFADTLSNPTHVTLFKVEPLSGVCVLEVNPRLGLTIVDRLMGGAGHSSDVDRDLSEIEVALLDQATQIIIGEWCNHWTSSEELRPVILGHENNGRFVQTSSPATITLSISLEAKIGDCQEKMQIGFPCMTLEPLIRRLSMKVDSVAKEAEAAPMGPPRWRSQFDSVNVPVKAYFPDMKIPAGDLAKMKVGDVLTWDPDVVNQIKLNVASLPKFSGRLGRSGPNWAVEINEIIKT